MRQACTQAGRLKRDDEGKDEDDEIEAKLDAARRRRPKLLWIRQWLRLGEI